MPRFNIEFSDAALEAVVDGAKRRGTTKAEYLRHCLGLYRWFVHTRDSGSKIVVEHQDGRLFQVVSL